MPKALHPIWFRFSKRFYEKLELLAETSEITPEETLEYSLDLLAKVSVAAQAGNTPMKDFIDQHRLLLRALHKDAKAHKVSWRTALEDAVKLFHLYGPLSTPLPKYGSPLPRSPASIATLRWARVSPEDRSKHARELSAKRWQGKKEARSQAAAEQERKQV